MTEENIQNEEVEDQNYQDVTHYSPEGNGSDEPAEMGHSSHDEYEGAEGQQDVDDDDRQDMFPRDYVEKLRDENAKYRQRAQRADKLAQRLHQALVESTGRLADPTDMPFDESHLDDPEALQDAVEDLVARKPHLASRRPRGDVGQGASSSAGDVDLAALLRERA